MLGLLECADRGFAVDFLGKIYPYRLLHWVHIIHLSTCSDSFACFINASYINL